MSVSSHLTPEPERRLWVLLEQMQRSVEWSDHRIGALTAFAMLEAALIKMLTPVGPLSLLALLLLAAALPLGVLAFSPLTRVPQWLTIIDPARARASVDHCMITPEDISKYTHGELVHRFDKYLGGGITATPYHEDITGQIVVYARVAVRKQRLFSAQCIVVGIAQLGVFASLLWR